MNVPLSARQQKSKTGKFQKLRMSESSKTHLTKNKELKWWPLHKYLISKRSSVTLWLRSPSKTKMYRTTKRLLDYIWSLKLRKRQESSTARKFCLKIPLAFHSASLLIDAYYGTRPSCLTFLGSITLCQPTRQSRA